MESNQGKYHAAHKRPHHADDNVAQKAALHIHELAGNPPHQGA